MKHASAVPKRLRVKYHAWRDSEYADNKATFHALAEIGQDPRDMVISCCDSRVHVTSIFGATQGELFVHRNIAALVPPYEPDGQKHGTSAAIEYAVTALKVDNILVVGHSQCGGVEGCYRMCSGEAPALLEKSSFVGRWMDVLRPGFERLEEGDETQRLRQLEKESVLVSLDNLMTFPFVKEAVEAGTLALQGLWNDIGGGRLEAYDAEEGGFREL